MPIKVCFVMLRAYALFSPAPDRDFGGAEVQVYLLSKYLAKDRDFEVTCISRDYGQPDGEILEGVRQRKIFQGSQSIRKIPVVSKAISVCGLYRAIASVDADVYFQRCAAIETGVAAYYCQRKNRPFVYGFSSDKDADLRLRQAEPALLWKSFEYGIRRARKVICQNEYQKQKVLQRWGLVGEIYPSLVEIPENSANRSSDGFSLWVGRGTRLKQVEVLLRLAERLSERQFVVIMPPGPDRQYYEQVVFEVKKHANIGFESHVPFEQIDSYFRGAALHINTSTYEGFPNTFLQAMKWGVPIVSLSVDPDGILSDHGAGLCAGGNEGVLAQQVERLLDDPALARSLGQKGREYVEERHDAEKVAERYKQLIRSVVKEQ